MNEPVGKDRGHFASLVLLICLFILPLLNVSAAWAETNGISRSTNSPASGVLASSDLFSEDKSTLKQDFKKLGRDTKKAVGQLKDNVKESDLHKSVRKAFSKTKEALHQAVDAIDKTVRKWTHSNHPQQ